MDKKKKLGNKGFSLVELIIVVAIMIILVGVLAPQYIKYLDKSRIAADTQLADNVRQAMTTTLLDPTVTTTLTPGTKGTLANLGGSEAATEFWPNVYGVLGVSGITDLKKALKYDSANAVIAYEVDTNSKIIISIYGGKYGEEATPLIVIQ